MSVRLSIYNRHTTPYSCAHVSAWAHTHTCAPPAIHLTVHWHSREQWREQQPASQSDHIIVSIIGAHQQVVRNVCATFARTHTRRGHTLLCARARACVCITVFAPVPGAYQTHTHARDSMLANRTYAGIILMDALCERKLWRR